MSIFSPVPVVMERFLKQKFIETEKGKIACSGSHVPKNRY